MMTKAMESQLRPHLQTTDNNVFRRCEKLYKQRHIINNISKTSMKQQLKQYELQSTDIDNAWNDMIDLTNIDRDKLPNNIILHAIDISPSHNTVSTLQSTSQLYSFTHIPGFYIIHNALNIQQQLYWCSKCVTQYSTAKHNNLTNLQPDIDTTQLWSNAVHSNNFIEFNKLRWSSLGYHYDWTQRTYSADNKDDIFDPELSLLCTTAANLCSQDILCESAIVNYYVDGGSMGGHVDDAELTDSKPIVSVSLASDCIFLLGGKTRNIRPTAFKLHSGDITVMSGESRLYYHGVPRILEHTFDIDAASKYIDNNNIEQQRLLKYLSTARLNINVRQVVDEQHNFDNTFKESYNTVYK